jgi:hypothetical protein
LLSSPPHSSDGQDLSSSEGLDVLRLMTSSNLVGARWVGRRADSFEIVDLAAEIVGLAPDVIVVPILVSRLS